MSGSTWQDRRFMGLTPKEIHQGSRRYSGSTDSKPTEVPKMEEPPTSIVEPAEPEKKFSFAPFDGDRRFMFPSSREVHQPARRLSGSSTTKAVDLPKASSPPVAATPSGGIAGAIAGRRRSSASSQGGAFSGLFANRSSDEHDQRRQNWEDMKAPGGLGGFFSGLVNKPSEKK